MRLFSAATAVQQAAIDRPVAEAVKAAVMQSLAADAAGIKFAADPTTSYSLGGKLYLSKSGWLLLSVPNSVGRGFFDALQEHGVELPTRDTGDPEAVFNAHVSVMSKDEVDAIGPERITERGHTFHYTTGPVKEITPGNWVGVSRVWALTVYSPELKNLRKSYGLSPLPHGDWEFHCTFAIRRTNVLRDNNVAKGNAANSSNNKTARASEPAGVQQLARNEGSLPQSKSSAVQGLRWSWGDDLCEVAGIIRSVSGGYGTKAAEARIGSPGEQLGLFSGELYLVDETVAGAQQTKQSQVHGQRRDVAAGRMGHTLGDYLWNNSDANQSTGLDSGTCGDNAAATNKLAKVIDPSFDPAHAEECCPNCGARQEQGDNGTCNRCGARWEHGESAATSGLGKEANGDMLAFKAWKATGLSDEEADRKAGESLELPGDKKITPSRKSKRVHEEDVETCPHCEQEIGEKGHYVDDDGYEYHRGCVDKGPIGRVSETMQKLIREGRMKSASCGTCPDCGGNQYWAPFIGREFLHPHCMACGRTDTTREGRIKSAGLKEDIDAAGAECEEPKSEEQARAGNYRHGHCNLHGMPITIETGKGMTRKGTDKNGKPWSITMAHHYGYIKRTESEADGDHIDVFIGPEPESEIVFIVDQVVDGKFDEHKCLLGFKSKEDAKAGYLACYADGWKGLDAITALTIPQFKEWCRSGNTAKPLAGQKITHKQAEFIL